MILKTVAPILIAVTLLDKISNGCPRSCPGEINFP